MMEELNMKSLSLSIAMILAGAVSGIAGTSVWSVDKKTGNDVQPARWGDVYANPEGQAKGELKLTDEGYVFSTELVLNSSTYSSAGFSIVWKRSNTEYADLSSYSGLCLTYKADRPFRVDFKQPSVTDYNFHGVVLPAQDTFVAKFIDFQNLEQEGGWGKTVALDLTQQQGIQINYKEGIVAGLEESDANRTKNVIVVSAVSLGDCDEPVVEDSLVVLAPYNKVQQVTIKETDTLKIDLKKVFAASNAEGVTVTPTMTRAVLNQVKPAGVPTIKDEVFYVPSGIDKDTTLSLIFIASDGSKSAIAQIDVTITDEAEGPICPGDPRCPDNPPPENHPTKLLPPYDDGKPVVLDTMPETDTLRIALGTLFADEDNDKLTFAVEMSVPLMKNLTALDKVSLKDSLVIVPSGVKADTSLTVTVSATDGKSDLVKVVFVVRIKDSNTPPVAKTVEYDANEDLALIVPTSSGIAVKGGSDLDGDDFLVILVDETKHGTLTGFSQLGSFTYKSEPNYHGDDTLTYVLVETANHKMKSSVAMAIIHVLPVNDAPTFVVADSAFLKDTLSFDMNFDEDTVKQVKVPTKSLVFSDIEVVEGTQKLTYKAQGNRIEAVVDSVNTQFYFISVKPVLDSCGAASIFLYATDGTDSAGVNIPVTLISPKDVAHAENDEYTAFNDTILVVDAKKGVLANDVYPEGMTTGMTAEVAQQPKNGTLTLNKDGSFTYKAEAGFTGVDRFGYFDVINGTKSKAAIVTISVEKRNQLPTVVVKPGSLDTTVTEDFPTSRALKYTKSVVTSWFKDPEGDSLTYTAKSKDGKLKVEITSAGILEINSAPDSTGKAYVVVTATDKKSGSKSFEFCVTIAAVNDKPVLLHGDTAYVANAGWTVKWKLDTLVKDVDGDKLEFSPNETSALTKYMTISMKGSELTVKSIDGFKYTDGKKYALGVKASDPSGANVTIPLYIIINLTGLKPQLAQPKATWQNAVTSKRGAVSIMDMQGRKVWSAKLPVNPSEVLNASAKVQGRKILRVNNQTWTIK